jgi:hypothetical protein
MNQMRIAFGTVSYCQSCQALTACGISRDLLVALGIPSQALKGWLEGHAAYHRRRADEYREKGQDAAADAELATATKEEWLPGSEAYKALMAQAEVANKPKPKPLAKRPQTQEELALQEFLWLARKRKERNNRLDNKPVVKPLNAEPFAGWK